MTFKEKTQSQNHEKWQMETNEEMITLISTFV